MACAIPTLRVNFSPFGLLFQDSLGHLPGGRQIRIPDDKEVAGGLNPITWLEIDSK